MRDNAFFNAVGGPPRLGSGFALCALVVFGERICISRPSRLSLFLVLRAPGVFCKGARVH